MHTIAWRARVRRHLIRGVGLLAAVAGIASPHFVTDPSRVVLHEIYNYLSYVPIIFGAYWVMTRGKQKDTSAPKTVLLIDDDVNLRRVVEYTLHEEGYRVPTAADRGDGRLLHLRSEELAWQHPGARE